MYTTTGKEIINLGKNSLGKNQSNIKKNPISQQIGGVFHLSFYFVILPDCMLGGERNGMINSSLCFLYFYE